FAKAFNAADAAPALRGYKIVSAYPYGSRMIPGAGEKIAANSVAIRQYGVQVADSIADVLQVSDAVMILTNDGRLHLQQAEEVISAGKPVFVDKPLAAGIDDAVAILAMAARRKVPVFSASSLRYMQQVEPIRAGVYGNVLGADIYGPAPIEPSHPDLFWYGIHGIETLCTVMGPGCISVARLYTDSTDIVAGCWPGDRVGVFRGTRTGVYEYGGTVFCEKQDLSPGPYRGYGPLLEAIAAFFDTGTSPVAPATTIEIYALMTAAGDSRSRRGATVVLDTSKYIDRYHELANR
ncbi:MAG: Gfo/Idh/MocA family oxidoreductase, partial [Bacteroidetes bacterium]|nr:Gfo/Idh/MocA family oxidoreductase [Bacteroidota bacterium]